VPETGRELRAIVTGGGAGIGLTTARMLADAGARVACLDLDVSAVGDPLLALYADVSTDAVAKAVDEAAEQLGGLDVLVNNAGILARGRVEDTELDEWRRVFDVNVFGMVRTTQAALPWLRQSKDAAIVNTCSLGAVIGLPAAAAYSASKGAVLALTRSMAADYLCEGIRVNCVTPAPVDTGWVRRIVAAAPDPAAALREVATRSPHGRLVQPEEVAAAICFLASPAAGSTTGASLPLDGGSSAMLFSSPRPSHT
jgi:NAD(P)-dependent dehydrogenase (short-subunit alcohol dehydrogenase family)